MTWKTKNTVHIEVLCILERHWWKVRMGVSGFPTLNINWHDLNYKNANNFLGFKLPKNMHIEFLCISEVAAGKMTCYHFKSGQAICTLVQNDWVNQRLDRLHNSSFFSNQHTHYHIDFALFIDKGGRTWKTKWIQHNIYTSSASASAVSADWDIAPPLQNVRVDTQYVGIIEEQKQRIKQLQEELAEFNRVQYRTLPANASRGKNVLRSSKKVSMTQIDHINQQAVASYVREAILARKQDASKELK